MGRRYWPMVSSWQPCATRSRSVRSSSSSVSPRPSMMPDLVLIGAPLVSHPLEQLERAIVARARPHHRMQALHRLDVVVDHVGPRLDHPLQIVAMAAEVRDQHLDHGGGALADLVDRRGEDRCSRRPARSSRATEVITVWRRFMPATASPTRRGSSQSTKPLGLPGATAQKPQRRVHRSPRIMMVAVPRAQQCPRLGQRASSHTVCSLRLRSSALVSA